MTSPPREAAPHVVPLGGGRGRPFGAAIRPLCAIGYVEEEFLVSGWACTYDLGQAGRPTEDGKWAARPARSLPYATRILVRRPAATADFNGTVVAIWTNVSLGWDLADGESPGLIDAGFAVAIVSAQQAGVHGMGPKPTGLVQWDPERYGGLSIPTDDVSYDIFSQAVRAIRAPDLSYQADPMGGLVVERVLATGSSQGSVRLATYLNAVQPLTGLVDGFLLELYVGAGAPLAADDPAVMWPTLAHGPFPAGWHLLRTDTGAKVFVLTSESDVLSYYPVRQPDDDSYRLWEVTGTTHSGLWAMELVVRRYEREFGQPFPLGTKNPRPNRVDPAPARDAGFHHLHRWVRGGEAPPSVPPLLVSGHPPRIKRDELGNALGGYRLPDLDVPVARHSAFRRDKDRPTLTGVTEPLTAADLEARYGDRDRYVGLVEQAVQRAMGDGRLLPADAARAVDAARQAGFPPAYPSARRVATP